jgi:hypothetical protein
VSLFQKLQEKQARILEALKVSHPNLIPKVSNLNGLISNIGLAGAGAIDEDYYDEDDEDYAPGPGSYYNPHQSTTFKVKQVPERLQFFGSTVERFQDPTIVNDKNKIPPNVGPGTYAVNSSFNANKMRMSGSNVPFATSNQRF